MQVRAACHADVDRGHPRTGVAIRRCRRPTRPRRSRPRHRRSRERELLDRGSGRPPRVRDVSSLEEECVTRGRTPGRPAADQRGLRSRRPGRAARIASVSGCTVTTRESVGESSSAPAAPAAAAVRAEPDANRVPPDTACAVVALRAHERSPRPPRRARVRRATSGGSRLRRRIAACAGARWPEVRGVIERRADVARLDQRHIDPCGTWPMARIVRSSRSPLSMRVCA